MVVPVHLSWKEAIASSIAFFWAEEPSPFRVPPLGQSEAELLELAELSPDGLLSEPHAVNATEPTRAMLANRPRRWIFTVFKPLHRGNQHRASMPDGTNVGRLREAAVRGG